MGTAAALSRHAAVVDQSSTIVSRGGEKREGAVGARRGGRGADAASVVRLRHAPDQPAESSRAREEFVITLADQGDDWRQSSTAAGEDVRGDGRFPANTRLEWAP